MGRRTIALIVVIVVVIALALFVVNATGGIGGGY
jgi:hypothetical protein